MIIKKVVYILISALVLISCNNNSKAKKADKTGASTAADSLKNMTKPNSERYYSVIRSSYQNKYYSLIVKSVYILNDSFKYDSSYYCQGNYVYLINNTNNILDSIELEEGCMKGVVIHEITNQRQLTNAVLGISSPSANDLYVYELIEYNNGRLKKICKIPEQAQPIVLQQKDKGILTGVASSRNEITNELEDYPITISLSDYKVKFEKPAKQYIGYTTEVLEEVNGYCLTENNGKTKYQIPKGTPVFIDSLNRSENIIKVIIKDRIIVYVPFQRIKNRIQISSAG